jgi:hypothetical protein
MSQRLNLSALASILLLLGLVKVSTAQHYADLSINWQNLANGLSYAEIDAPIKSDINDSKLSILKIKPDAVDFLLLNASEQQNNSLNALQWAEKYNLLAVVNAAMYEVSNGIVSRGYMKNYGHINNPKFKDGYNAVIAFNPKDSTLKKFKIFDLMCDSWDSIKSKYHCYAQGMRMIDCNANALSWNKKKQSCSMMVACEDLQGYIYFIFCRSPYTHNQMIGFLKALPLELRTTIYLEGGPETSLFIKTANQKIEKIGSYISDSYPNDDNDHFWKLPNVIGIRPITKEPSR